MRQRRVAKCRECCGPLWPVYGYEISRACANSGSHFCKAVRTLVKAIVDPGHFDEYDDDDADECDDAEG